MRPIIFDKRGGINEAEIFNNVKLYHKEFKGTYSPTGCGEIHFFADDSTHTQLEVETENVHGQLREWADFIRDDNSNYVAVSFTCFRQRPDGKTAYKETCYMHKANSNAIILETDMVDTGLGIPVFSSEINIRELAFWQVSNLHHDILDALEIEY